MFDAVVTVLYYMAFSFKSWMRCKDGCSDQSLVVGDEPWRMTMPPDEATGECGPRAPPCGSMGQTTNSSAA